MNVPVLQKAWDEYLQTVEHEAKTLYYAIVQPFCRARGYTFNSGMGTFVISDENGIQLDEDDSENDKDPELVQIFEVLNLDVPGLDYPIGTLMSDYPRKFT